MKLKMIPIAFTALRAVPKDTEKKLGELKIKERIETI